MKIVITLPQDEISRTFWSEEIAERINAMGDVWWNPKDEKMTKEELLEVCGDADVILTGWASPQINRDIVQKAEQLKMIVHVGGSVAGYLCPEVYERGIKVIGGNNFFAESVAEGTIAYILASLREIPYFSYKLQKEKQFLIGSYNEGLLGKTIGIVSYGAISQYLVKMLQVFRVKIKVYSRSISQEEVDKYHMQRADLPEIFSTCDIVSIHTALNEHTYHMIDSKLLSKLKEGSLFVNTARGAVVDEDDLIRELKTGRFKAVIDVFEHEPFPDDSGWYDLDNVILMPHMGGPTVDRRKYITNDLMQEAYAYLTRGEPRNEMTFERFQGMSYHYKK